MQARMDLERMLALEEVGRREGIEVSQEELTDEIVGIARRTASSADRVRKALQPRGMDRLADRLHHNKVLQFLVDHADITGEGEAAAEPAAQPDSEAREEQS
jgi:FKBP-type peptidyl-prolyl cis-trans isomerase (trigger factor)